MAETKFTRGPWAEHGRGGCECGQIFGPDGNSVIAIVQGPMHLGLDGPDCVPSRQGQQANARLIAAAPELYETLEELVHEVETYGGVDTHWLLLNNAHAALAKARGESDA